MKVKELIEKLKEFNENYEIIINDDIEETSHCSLNSVKWINAIKHSPYEKSGVYLSTLNEGFLEERYNRDKNSAKSHRENITKDYILPSCDDFYNLGEVPLRLLPCSKGVSYRYRLWEWHRVENGELDNGINIFRAGKGDGSFLAIEQKEVLYNGALKFAKKLDISVSIRGKQCFRDCYDELIDKSYDYLIGLKPNEVIYDGKTWKEGTFYVS